MARQESDSIPVSEWPKYLARIEPGLKARLDATSAVLDISVNAMINEAMQEYLRGVLNRRDRQLVDTLAKNIERRRK